MRVLFQIRPDYLTNMAGDTIQLLKTKYYLEKLGLIVEVATRLVDLRPYQVVHLFNTTRVQETYRYFYYARQKGKPVALSTIYWDATEFHSSTRQPLKVTTAWVASDKLRKQLFREVDILLPNARLEIELIIRQFKAITPYHIVPNGVDKFFFTNPSENFTSFFGLRNFILCVGRIAPRKNQLALAEALQKSGLTLVLLGPVNDPAYVRQCAAAGSHVKIINFIEHHKLKAAYASAKVHVLPSWFETPGLTSLEAGLAGCRVVTTDRGTAREYFEDLVWYCQPDNPSSIRQAVLEAYNSSPDERLKNHILHNFTWEKAAEETLKAYKKISF